MLLRLYQWSNAWIMRFRSAIKQLNEMRPRKHRNRISECVREKRHSLRGLTGLCSGLRSGRDNLPLYVFCLQQMSSLVRHHPGQRRSEPHSKNPWLTLIFARSSPCCSRMSRSHSSWAFIKAGSTCRGSPMTAGGRTFLGARILNLGSG